MVNYSVSIEWLEANIRRLRGCSCGTAVSQTSKAKQIKLAGNAADDVVFMAGANASLKEPEEHGESRGLGMSLQSPRTRIDGQ